MEGTLYRSRLQDSYGGRESAIEGAGQVFCRDGGLKGKAGHLGEGVDAGVGAAGTLGEGRFAGDAAQGGLQLALDGGFTGLNLPAPELGAVVGQGELPGLQAGCGLGAYSHRHER